MNTNKKKQLQQGDVLIKKVMSPIPEGKKVILHKDRLVLAEGETTGHYHAVVDDGAEMFAIGDRTFINLKNPATLVHQEHGPVEIPEGLSEIGVVQEYDYFSKMQRKVED
jgi:hypothetical protein